MKISHALALASILTATLSVIPVHAAAEDVVHVSGRIMAADGKTPLTEAAIAAYDEKGKVIAHGKTDADGRYTLAVPRGALHLTKKKGGNFLGGILKGAGSLLNVAAGVAPMAMGGLGGLGSLGNVAGLAGGSNPLGAISGLAGGGNPLGALAGSGGRLSGGAGMPQGMDMRKMMEMAKKNALAAGVDSKMLDEAMKGYGGMFGDDDGGFGEDAPAANAPGAMILRVTAAGRSEAGGVGQLYWMQDETVQEEGKEKKRTSAWVDPICLAKEGDELPSRIVRGYFAIVDGGLDPAIVEVGKTVTVAIKLPLPDEPKVDLVVIARNAKTGETWELTPDKEPGVYKAEIPVDKAKFAKNDQTLSILAYARDPKVEGRSKKAEDAISGAGLWKLDKRFEYNPRIVASRNRVDLRLTVVEPAKEK
jgi:hypothetical protein